MGAQELAKVAVRLSKPLGAQEPAKGPVLLTKPTGAQAPAKGSAKGSASSDRLLDLMAAQQTARCRRRLAKPMVAQRPAGHILLWATPLAAQELQGTSLRRSSAQHVEQHRPQLLRHLEEQLLLRHRSDIRPQAARPPCGLARRCCVLLGLNRLGLVEKNTIAKNEWSANHSAKRGRDLHQQFPSTVPRHIFARKQQFQTFKEESTQITSFFNCSMSLLLPGK